MRIALLALVLLLPSACATPRGGDLPTTELRILAYNIRHGAGMDLKLDLQRTADLIARFEPDVVTLQEVDKNCKRTGGVDQAAWLAKTLGMHAAFGAFMPYQGGEYGMAILSREPILEANNIRLPEGAEPRSALAARIATASGEVIVTSIHLYRTQAERLAQAETLIEHFRGETLPVILAGDFNSQPDGRVMTRFSEHWSNVEKTGPSLTFPADMPDREIDFCLLRPKERMHGASLQVIEEVLVSDHRPILLVLKLRAQQ